MHCENCRRTVTEAVNSMEGYAAKVDILTKECRVSYENGPDIEEVIRSIRQAGFDAFVMDK
ncbi:heavy metal-associated domain-containing protein [Lachnospiraceae bacterium 47-T17]